MPIQQMLLGAGAVATKPYVDDVFSTYLFKANGSTGQTINNGINLSGEGGLVWHKDRDATYNHVMWDTVRGDDVIIRSDTNAANSTVTNGITFNSNGYSVNTAQGNESTNDTVSWTFRKAPGFFDVVTYTGDGNSRTIAHSLGCIPGCIIIKRTDGTEEWAVYHRDTSDSYLMLNKSNAASSNNTFWNNGHTATTFGIGTNSYVNSVGNDFVAYVFAGGASTAATAKSVDFDQSGDYLSIGSSSDFTMGTGDFTVECWVYIDDVSTISGFFQISDTSGGLTSSFNTIAANWEGDDNGWQIYGPNNTYTVSSSQPASSKTWIHVAYVRSSGTTKLYINGTSVISMADTTNYNGTYIAVGGSYSTGYLMGGKISNLRVVKGTAVYTSSFRPPTEPLTNITNTKLLCCNNSSTTGSTVTPGTITANGNPSPKPSSPFDDPAAYVFGDAEDQNVIKCGSYVGTTVEGLKVNIGWEPQWILFKNTATTNDWRMFDSMRGIVTGGNDGRFNANDNSSESTSNNKLDITPTGFTCEESSPDLNGNGNTIIYVAIRRPDGYVGKPPELGTDVFAMDTGASSSTIPNYTSGFPVDLSFRKNKTGTSFWQTSARLIQGKAVWLNSTNAEGSSSGEMFDSNVGYGADNNGSNFQNWMFKRHAGFDVVTYTGNDVAGRQIPHSLNAVPEMLWLKRRDTTTSWYVYHKGLNNGSSPENYTLLLEGTSAEIDSNEPWNDTAPTATHFTLGDSSGTNGTTTGTFIAMLFASVDGISKVGSYTGGDSNPGPTITTGFQPRFIMIKSRTASGSWHVFDSTRGINSSSGGVDQNLSLNSNSAQTNAHDLVSVSSTGFTLNVAYSGTNAGYGYIYYAHA